MLTSNGSHSNYIPISNRWLDWVKEHGFICLPADIFVNDDFSVEFKSYISNLHPVQYKQQYSVIAEFVSKSVPLFEQVLADLVHLQPLRIPLKPRDSLIEKLPTDSYFKDCIIYEYGNDWRKFVCEWENGVAAKQSKVRKFTEPKIPSVPLSLRNRNMQVHVEMYNYIDSEAQMHREANYS
ncbi:hypothetical protein FB639_003800, partial [Coemansia asiatica]